MKLSVGTETASELVNYSKILNDTKTIFYTCHCTGIEQYNYLKEIMKDQLEYLSAGSYLEV
jgi:7,8-dihydropterin-6-yl-methyl-4-(beta-D-ribofuranosyl)aminobenzene 5'-phosphate synthase